MINQDKVKLMAKIQHFEDTEKKALKAYSMYQRDYMGLFMLRSFVAYIVLLGIAACGFCMYNWDTFLKATSIDTLFEAGKGLLYGFGLLLIPVMIVSSTIYWFRYHDAEKKMKGHLNNLKKLNEFYDQNTESVE